MQIPLLVVVAFAALTYAQIPQSIGYGVDLTDYGTVQTFQCIRNLRYSYAFIGVYNSVGNGTVYSYAVQNVAPILAGLKIHIVHAPAPQSSKSGATQFLETYNTLKAYGVSVHTVFLQITSPISWPNNPQKNSAFIADFVNAAARVNVHVAFYTNWYDWEQITGGWVTTPRLLWYWNTLGNGVDAAGSDDFTDFRPFGGFTSPYVAVKQYRRNLSGCGVAFNGNRFVSGLVFMQANAARVEVKKEAEKQ
uniref:GH26 domain-containing protein n=1 Tax=Steinernema glaseri TaxID=37863 RepID=A0A1I7YJL8_9BILA